MKRPTRTLAAAAAAVLTATAITTATAPPAHADIIGCPPGWACLYHAPSTAPLVDRFAVDYSWYHYGTYNIHNEYGLKDLCNQQTGGAVIRLYSGYNGTGTVLVTLHGDTTYQGHLGNCRDVNTTPVNSVRLSTS